MMFTAIHFLLLTYYISVKMGLEDLIIRIVKHPFESLMKAVLVYAVVQAVSILRPFTIGQWTGLVDRALAIGLASFKLLSVVGTVTLFVFAWKTISSEFSSW